MIRYLDLLTRLLTEKQKEKPTFRSWLIRVKKTNIFETAKLSEDSGFCTKENMKLLLEGEIDVYVKDKQFSKRDPRCAG